MGANMGTMTRRGFLHTAFSSCAGFAATGTMGAFRGFGSPQDSFSPQTSQRVFSDLHVHYRLLKGLQSVPLTKMVQEGVGAMINEFSATEVDWAECHRKGVDLLCISHYNPIDEWFPEPLSQGAAASNNVLRIMDLVERELRGEDEKDEKKKPSQYARVVRNYSELCTALGTSKTDQSYRIKVVHTLEGSHSLGGKLEALQEFADRGVALIGLTHYFDKSVAASATALPILPDSRNPSEKDGLTGFGKEVIHEMERLGLIVDVTHCSSYSVADVLRTVSKPFVASHSSVKTLGEHPSSLLEEHIQEISRRGGLIGVALHPFVQSNFIGLPIIKEQGSLQDVVRAVRHLYKICGTHKHLGIGSEFAGFMLGPKDMRKLSQIDKLQKLLLAEFNDEDMVKDIMANNVIDFLLRNWRSGNPVHEK